MYVIYHDYNFIARYVGKKFQHLIDFVFIVKKNEIC